MTRRNIISLTLLLAGVASLAVCNLGIERGHAIAPVPLSQLGLVVDHSEQAAPVAAQMPTFFVVGANGEDNTRKNVRLWDFAKIANNGQHLPNYPQQTGDCVSFGAKNACEYFLAAAIGKGILDSEFHLLYPPYIYGGSRVIVGKGRLGRSAGSVGAWAAEWVASVGGVLKADDGEVPPYSGKIADEWGYKGPPSNLVTSSKQFTFSTVAPVKSAADVRDALCNGYPVTIASDFGTTKITVKDGRRVATRNTKWYHQMCLIAYDGSGSQPWYYCLNSWGESAHPDPLQGEPPGGFWMGASDVEYIVRQGDSFAYSGFDGFPAQEFVPDFHVIGAAGPTPTVPVTESPAMFPLSPDVQLPGTLLGIALIVVAMVIAFYRGNGIGRWAAVALLIAIIGMPSIVTAQDQSPVDFGMLVTTASGVHSAVTTVRFDESVNPMFSALVHAAEEPMPVDFTVLTRSACEQPKPAVKPSREASRTVMPAVREPIPMATVTDYSYPTRSDHWTHPGTIRSHVLSGVHAGKLTPEQVALMTDAELEAWHSDDHEGKSHQPAKIAKTVAAAPNWGGYTRFIWTDGTTRDTPQPGTYYPTAGGVLVPASTTAANPVRSMPVYRSGGCPGGNCPVNRSSGFNLFRRG